ncbi:hypothetical protein, partial [Pseudomonas sp. 69_B]|uniref:hypothetical protein n=1 Tax=Pseudomonas sp. 69_B TaxID=2813563 RepID=UPI001A9E42E2
CLLPMICRKRKFGRGLPGLQRNKPDNFNSSKGLFASRLAPTVERILSGGMQSTVGASLLAKAV